MAKVVFSSYYLIIPDFFSKITKLGKSIGSTYGEMFKPKNRHPIVKQKLIHKPC